MSPQTKTTEDFIRKARSKHGEFYDYSKSVYQGAHTPLIIGCPLHGDFLQRPADHANVGKGCKLCGNRRGSPKSLTLDKFKERAAEVHGGFYDYSASDYRTTKLPVSIMCPVHGEFKQAAGKHLCGYGCPVCRKGKKIRKYRAKTREERASEWIEAARVRHNNRYDYSKSVFVNSKVPVQIICPEHGSFYQTPGNHLNGGCKCPGCAQAVKSDKLTKSHDHWLSGFNCVHGGAYDYSCCAEILSCQQYVKIVCPKHGPFRQKAYAHMDGHGCPRCFGKISDPETELREWVESLLPGVEVKHSVRSVIPPLELDIYIPSRNLALEFNGVFWHSDVHKPRLYHQDKTLRCHAKGVQLLHVYEYDWTGRKDACKRMIADKLRLVQRKLDARKLVVRIPDTRVARAFLQDNHFQGPVASCVSYGLYDGAALVSVMTFGKPRYTSRHTWELLRFCSLAGTCVRGGAGKLFKRFTADNLSPGDTVVSYARMDYSNGGVYETLGFIRDGVCVPDYVWFRPPGRLLSRHATQKHRLPKLLGSKFKPDASEAVNMRSAGYKRIYSAGNLRYTYTHARS